MKNPCNLCSCLLVVPVLLALVNGCSRETPPTEITEVRDVPVEERVEPPMLTTAERMGMEQRVPASAETPAAMEGLAPMESGPPEASLLRWRTPEAWREGEERPMRLATLIPEDSSGVECVVTVLAGAAGGVIPNLNRWRAQVGLAPLTELEAETLERVQVLGVAAAYMTVSGVLPETGDAVQVFGLVCPLPDYTVFVKMTGPPSEMAGEEERFMTFIRSFHFEENAHS